MKLLLGFAVGGLLSDVFLHLLPEAWQYENKTRKFFYHLTITICLSLVN